MSRLCLFVALATAVVCVGVAAGVVNQEDNLRVSVDGRIEPKRLPRQAEAPISVSVTWRISSTDGRPPPKLRELSVEINRYGRFQTAGLPRCPYAKIQPATIRRALANCRSSLVGRGSFTAEIALKGSEQLGAYETTGPLLFFNGESKGRPVLFGHIYSAHPFATSFVIPFGLERRANGPYGAELSAAIPKALRSWGNLTRIQMRLARRYSYQGKPRSFLTASCPAPEGANQAVFPLARTSFSFLGGIEQTLTVIGDCRTTGP
jgi:hypothetical protein